MTTANAQELIDLLSILIMLFNIATVMCIVIMATFCICILITMVRVAKRKEAADADTKI